MKDLMALKLHNKNHLESFFNRWNLLIQGLDHVPDEKYLEILYYDEIRDCKQIENEISYYHRLPEGHAEKTYKYRWDCTQAWIVRERKEKNRRTQLKALAAGGQPSGKGSWALAAKGKGGRVTPVIALGSYAKFLAEVKNDSDRALTFYTRMEKAIEKGISTVIFDRNGFLYHGRIKSFADGARSGGLKF